MPRVNVLLESKISTTSRVRQLEAMFDVPPARKSSVRIKGNLPLSKQPWNVGLIVGPSGAGKSTVARQLWNDAVSPPLDWPGQSVIDDFGAACSADKSASAPVGKGQDPHGAEPDAPGKKAPSPAADLSIERIAVVCQAVGFNTIPAWLRPYSVLSTGEKFRVELARRLLELPDPIVVDEFTSVVDRQVAKIGAHAVQKYVRKHDRQFVAVTCHYDVLEWLQPDWVFEPATGDFQWRCLQPRPELTGTIARVDHAAWRLFRPYHYMSADLNRAARCYCLFVDGQPASFVAIIHRPHAKVRNIKAISRAVTLPDWQGLGLIFRLQNRVAAAYRALGFRVHHNPAHPAFIRSLDQSDQWALVRRSGGNMIRTGRTSTTYRNKNPGKWGPGGYTDSEKRSAGPTQGMRPCATFRYVGPALDLDEARQLTGAA
jgi:hypothetical protein